MDAEVVDQRCTDPARRDSQRDADLLHMGTPVHDGAEQVCDDWAAVVGRDPGQPGSSELPQFGKRRWLMLGDLMHPEFGEATARVSFDPADALKLHDLRRPNPQHDAMLPPRRCERIAVASRGSNTKRVGRSAHRDPGEVIAYLPVVTAEEIAPDVPARIAVAVVWARKRRPLRAPLGILVLAPGRVTLLDQESAVVLDAAPSELVASRDGKWRVCLTTKHDTVYVSGVAVQEARKEATRGLIERHNAVLVPPKPPSLSDKQWQSVVTSSQWASAPTDIRTQKVVWQATLISALSVAGVTVTPAERGEGPQG